MIQYKRGAEDKAADALSRRASIEKEGELLAVTEIIPQWIEKLKANYGSDEWAKEVLK